MSHERSDLSLRVGRIASTDIVSVDSVSSTAIACLITLMADLVVHLELGYPPFDHGYGTVPIDQTPQFEVRE